jgi:hypothetical protein
MQYTTDFSFCHGKGFWSLAPAETNSISFDAVKKKERD